MTATVRLDPRARARAAWPWLAPAAPAGSWWEGPTSELVRVLADGRAEPFRPGGHPHPGAASDPCAGGRP